MLYDSHMHTPLCRHATGLPREYAAIAADRGLAGIVFTCHNPQPTPDGGMSAAEFPGYVRMVDAARREWAGQVDVRLGLECAFIPGQEAFLRKQVTWAKFDFLLGSVHPANPVYRARYGGNDLLLLQRTYFEHLAVVAETKLFDCLAHPDLVKNVSPVDWELPRLLPTIRKALDRIAASGVAMELNTSGLYKEVPEFNPAPSILGLMRQRGIPVVLGSDAHTPQRVADRFEDALDLLGSAGFTHVSHFIERRRVDVPIAAARAGLRG